MAFSHSTKPPKILRQAEPDPRRANLERERSSNPSLRAVLQAPAKAASPLAEEANPAAVGTKF